ncbi:ABC transporter substrate-binding protein [Pseudozobellia sp. WGM2]|uniref:ABC transporter substrate-binding protein n=1 Tax=Pseudozobellia sp. WGM2 TaxID=2787625 RepID=UPI001ADED64D|nr:ABC transporter substrate-binding protein [Pseudozobellia sp. WGM2]
MLKVCSFMPAVTQMLYDMGLQHHLYGITFECPPQALEEKKPVVRCILEGKNYTSKQIDVFFSESKKDGRKLYYVDEPALAEIAPDIIFTQDTCDVCQIDTECTAAAVANLEKQPELISISPNNLKDVFDNAVTIAKALNREEVAYTYLTKLKRRIKKVTNSLNLAKVEPKEIALLEWVDPIYNCGHWIPYQINLAGGMDRLSNPSGDSMVTTWEKIKNYDPEVIVIAPCGFKTEKAVKEMYPLLAQDGWPSMKAVKERKIFIVDFDLFTQSSASTLVDGIELLAGLFHPDIVAVPEDLKSKYIRFYEM